MIDIIPFTIIDPSIPNGNNIVVLICVDFHTLIAIRSLLHNGEAKLNPL